MRICYNIVQGILLRCLVGSQWFVAGTTQYWLLIPGKEVKVKGWVRMCTEWAAGQPKWQRKQYAPCLPHEVTQRRTSLTDILKVDFYVRLLFTELEIFKILVNLNISNSNVLKTQSIIGQNLYFLWNFTLVYTKAVIWGRRAENTRPYEWDASRNNTPCNHKTRQRQCKRSDRILPSHGPQTLVSHSAHTLRIYRARNVIVKCHKMEL